MRLTWILPVAAGLVALLGIALLSGAGKFVLGLVLQLTAPTEVAAPALSPATHPFAVAFDATSSSPELFSPEGARDVAGLAPGLADGAWQRSGRHELMIRFGGADPTLRVTSFGTRLWHRSKRPTSVYFYPFEVELGYRQAVSASEQLFQSLGLADKVTWSEYETRLSDRPIDEFTPVLEFSSATLFLKLSCLGWNPALPAKAQLARASCHPVISIDAQPPSAATQAQGSSATH